MTLRIVGNIKNTFLQGYMKHIGKISIKSNICSNRCNFSDFSNVSKSNFFNISKSNYSTWEKVNITPDEWTYTEKSALYDQIASKNFRKKAKNTYIHQSAIIIGDATLGEHTSVWPNCVLRADVNSIEIGDGSNIQDGTVIHVAGVWGDKQGFPTVIGKGVTIGHKVLLHGCFIDHNVLIGMGSTVMDGVVIKSNVILGAGSLVPPHKTLEPGLWLGNPARRVRNLTEQEIAQIKYNAEQYVYIKNQYLAAP